MEQSIKARLWIKLLRRKVSQRKRKFLRKSILSPRKMPESPQKALPLKGS
jgi:hypothetical protein